MARGAMLERGASCRTLAGVHQSTVYSPEPRDPRNGEGVLFSFQALAGFTMGGLISIVATLAAGLYGEGWAQVAGRIAGFAACGALGGAALGVGLRPGAWKSGALGFGLGFLVPAMLAGSILTDLLALKVEQREPTSFVMTGLAFAAGYGMAGALGASFLDGRFALAIGVRVAAAGGLGGLLAGTGPLVAGDPSGFQPASVVMALALVVGGHMTACSLGGWLAGLAIENDIKARARPRLERRKPLHDAVAGD